MCSRRPASAPTASHAEVAATARAVLDQAWLAESLVQPLSYHPRMNVISRPPAVRRRPPRCALAAPDRLAPKRSARPPAARHAPCRHKFLRRSFIALFNSILAALMAAPHLRSPLTTTFCRYFHSSRQDCGRTHVARILHCGGIRASRWSRRGASAQSATACGWEGRCRPEYRVEINKSLLVRGCQFLADLRTALRQHRDRCDLIALDVGSAIAVTGQR